MSILLFGTYLVVIGLLLQIPIIGKYLKIINTLIHEMGHALMALLTGGSVGKIQLFANTEGTAWTSSRFWIGRFLTSIAGYPFASFIGFLFIYFLTSEPIHYLPLAIEGYELVLYTMIVFLVISLVFWVRNLYGFFWVLTITAAFAGAIWLDNDTLIEQVVFIITCIIFIESTKSAYAILLISFRRPQDAGDASNLAATTFIIPAQVWGVLFFAQALLFNVLGLMLVFK